METFVIFRESLSLQTRDDLELGLSQFVDDQLGLAFVCIAQTHDLSYCTSGIVP